MNSAGSLVSLLDNETSPSFLSLILDEWWVKNARFFLLLFSNKIKCIQNLAKRFTVSIQQYIKWKTNL